MTDSGTPDRAKMLPGVAAIGLWMFVLCVIGLVGVTRHALPPVELVFCAAFAVAGQGLLRLRRWGWAMTAAAVLFSAIVPASMPRLIFKFARASVISSTSTAPHATSSAAIVGAIMMACSLRWMESPRSSFNISFACIPHQSRQAEELGADLKARPLGRFGVDL